MKRFVSLFLLFISFVSLSAELTVDNLLGKTINILQTQGIDATKGQNSIKFKKSDINFEILISSTDNLFLFAIQSNFNKSFEKPMNTDIQELRSLGSVIQNKIPFIRMGFSVTEAGDFALLNKNLNYSDIIGYSCECDIENFINDGSILNDIVPFFIQILSEVSDIVKENVD